jgi:hypothetical protein
MKKLFLSLVLMLTIASILACEITIKVDGTEKSKYKTGDVVVVKVTLVLTHRNCLVEIKDTKFNLEGVKIAKATDWKEVSPGTWERKLKIKITAKAGESAKISVVRVCKRGGGNESLSFPM